MIMCENNISYWCSRRALLSCWLLVDIVVIALYIGYCRAK